MAAYEGYNKPPTGARKKIAREKFGVSGAKRLPPPDSEPMHLVRQKKIMDYMRRRAR